MPRILNTLVLSSLLSCCVYAEVVSNGTGYITGGVSNDIYTINLQTGAYSTLTTIPTGSRSPVIVDISLLNDTTAYALAAQTDGVYTINLQTGSYSLLTPNPISGIANNLISIAVANSSTAYVAGTVSNTIYTVNLQTGTSSPFLTIPGAPFENIVIENTSTAYAVANGTIYRINLQTGAYSTLLTSATELFDEMALSTTNQAYVVGNHSGTIYSINLQTGAYAPIVTLPGGINLDLEDLSLNGTTGYTVSGMNNTVYAVNLQTGQYSIIAHISNPIGSLEGMGTLAQIPLLSGNNRSLAKYLNGNANVDVIRTLALLPDGLGKALESVAPTRNALTTYASQNAYLASSQVVTDHLRQKRFHLPKSVEKPVALMEANDIDQFFADASETRFNEQPTRPNEETTEAPEEPECDRDPFTIWITPFGEYATEKAQDKTPAFNLGVGGAVGGIEYTTERSDVVGFGLAYVYTHVHENSHAGQGKVNQGFLTLYGTLNASKWYFDLGIWTGYYDTYNQRRISFPGVKETAKSNTHGWQLAPHFEVGYDGYWWCGDELNWFGIEPFLSGDWVANWEHKLREHGAGSFNMGQKGRFCSLIRGETGMRFHEIFTFDWGRIVLREKASYGYQKVFNTGSINAFLIGSPGSFTVDTLTGAQNLGVIEFSMLFIHNDPEKPYVDLRYQGEFGSKYQSHQVMLELGTNF